jgi:predicted DNA-binding transcriptional regulator YafY
MRRADRLFDLIQILRDGRLHRAADLGLRTGVSDRTIWRDMTTLMASGLPIEGERGLGYILRAPTTLPPMILTPAEREALRTGLRLVAEGRDKLLARAARSLADKIAAARPAPVEDGDDLFATPARSTERAARHLPLIRRAIRQREKLALTYLELDGAETHTDICPLSLDQSGQVLTLQVRIAGRGTRSLRLDRLLALDATGEHFTTDADA